MSSISGILYVEKFSCGEFTPPASSILNASIVTNAKISASKLQHRFQANYNQTGNGAADRRAVHVVHGATAVLNSFKAGSRVAATGDSTVTIDLKKNGSTLLSAPVVLDNANTAYTVETATLASTSLVAGDVLEVVVTVSAGTGTLPIDVFAVPQIDEDAN